MHVVKFVCTQRIRQIADNIPSEEVLVNQFFCSSSSIVKNSIKRGEDENILVFTLITDECRKPIHNIDNDKYAEINFVLRYFFSEFFW